MQITVLFNGILRQLAGQQQVVEIEAPATVEAVLVALSKAVPSLSPYLARTACAISSDIVSRQRVLTPGDQLVLIPPVSGG